MINIEQDRRESPRTAVKRPCKVYDPQARKYLAGTTCDVSSGGLLLRLDRPLGLGPGDRVSVGVAQTRRQMLLRTRDMVEA
ncbi:MAG: PilZ domain-containing protein, partial [Phycisphaerales bacterium]